MGVERKVPGGGREIPRGVWGVGIYTPHPTPHPLNSTVLMMTIRLCPLTVIYLMVL
jgi:hypothetical protein